MRNGTGVPFRIFNEMAPARTGTDEVSFKLCYLNARSLHKHIDDIRKDLNYTNTDINIISETRFINSDEDTEYAHYRVMSCSEMILMHQPSLDLLVVLQFTAEYHPSLDIPTAKT